MCTKTLRRGSTLAALLLATVPAGAEVTFEDGSTLAGFMLIDAARGHSAGGNLLHRFQAVSVAAGEQLLFTGPDSIERVIATVSGDARTDIHGLLGSTIADADLFLLNPNGIALGPDAEIEVDGALVLATSDSLLFADGSRLLVTGTGASGLSTAAPAAFGFTMDPADLQFDGVNLRSTEVFPGVFTPPPMRSLEVVGGDISFDGSSVFLAGGEIGLTALGAPGEVPLGAAPDTLVGGMELGAVTVRNDFLKFNADLETSGDPPGGMRIAAATLELEQGSLFADTLGEVAGPGIRIALSDTLILTNDSRITTDALGDGGGSSISVQVPNVRLDGAFTAIATDNRGAGNGGAITLDADDIRVGNGAQLSAVTSGDGDAGVVTLRTTSLNLDGAGAISGQTVGAGLGGSIDITASGTVRIAGAGSQMSTSALFFLPGSAGDIRIQANELVLEDGAAVLSESLTPFSGAPGSISISAEIFTVDGTSRVSSANASDMADGGVVQVDATRISLRGDPTTLVELATAQLSSSASGAGAGGSILLTGDSLTLSDNAGVEALTSGAGAAGSIQVTGSLELDSGRIDARTLASGAGGAVVLEGAVSLVNGGRVDTSTLGSSADAGDAGRISMRGPALTVSGTGSGLASATNSAGSGGQIVITSAHVMLSRGAAIDTSSEAAGAAGDINIQADALSLTDGGAVLSESLTALAGAPGAIAISTGVLEVEGNSAISTANASDTADGGVVQVDAARISIRGAPAIPGALAAAQVSSSASGAGAGGSILLTSDSVALSDNAVVAALTSGAGAAGSIQVDGSLDLNGGRIDARTLAAGAGGGVTLNGTVNLLNGGRVDTGSVGTSADAGDAGTINVRGPTLTVDGAGSGLASATSGAGAGGRIDVSATEVTVRAGGVIDTSTTAVGTTAGSAGDILVSADRVLLAGADTAVSSRTQGPASGGDLRISGSELVLRDQAEVSVAAAGTGDAGDIRLQATNSLVLLSGAGVRSSAALSGGGNVTVEVLELVRLQDSTITASSGGPATGADGGVVDIDPRFLILDNSQIVAQAAQGNGGFINLVADNYVRDVYSLVSASSARGNDGEVRIVSPDNSVAGAIGRVDVRMAGDGALLMKPCAARALALRSSLVVEQQQRDLESPEDYRTEAVRGCR